MHLVVAIVEVEDVAREHRRPSGEHLLTHVLPGAFVVGIGLLLVVDAERRGQVDLHRGGASGREGRRSHAGHGDVG